jgi:methylglyoxal synthase
MVRVLLPGGAVGVVAVVEVLWVSWLWAHHSRQWGRINRSKETTMPSADRTLPVIKRIALIAHDNRKADLLDWARFNRGTLTRHLLFGTGTTGGLINQELGLDVHRFCSGPLGGDQQVGAEIAVGGIDMVIFFWDPLQPLPHDVDVKALLRLAVVYNIPMACNRATADFLISSPLMGSSYDRLLVDYEPSVVPKLD